MKCPVCGAPRVSRYAAYCHVCGSPLPELPPEPEDAGGEPPASPAESYPTGSAPAADNLAGPAPVRQDYLAYQAPVAGQGAPPTGRPPQGGAARVYDRPETPPSVARRRRLTRTLLAVGVLVSLLFLAFGPLRSVLGARNGPDWTPGGTETSVVVVIPTLPPGVSAAQATARARHTATPEPTSTPSVEAGTPAGGGSGGAGATVVLPTLARATPVPTPATPVPAVTPSPTPVPPTATVVPPVATQAVPTEPPFPTLDLTLVAPTAAPLATAPPPTPVSTSAVSIPGANLPQAIAGGKVLAFVSDRSGSPQIWITDAAGANQIQVTNEGQNTNPAWSFDDRYLYYVGQRSGQTGVYRLDITTGKEEQVLQDVSVINARPLPGGQLATLRMEDGRYSLYIGDRRLFQLDRAFQYQFSPDGRQVVIDPNSPPREISVVDVSTTTAQVVAQARSWNAGWGQGNRLAYVSDRSGIASVYVAGPNGEGAYVVSPADKWSQAPAFSSDGSQIAFIGGDGGTWNVYTVGANGKNAYKAAGPANPSKSPVWQPGGQLIAFGTDRACNWDIYVTGPSGDERPLVTGPGNDVDPAWTW